MKGALACLCCHVGFSTRTWNFERREKSPAAETAGLIQVGNETSLEAHGQFLARLTWRLYENLLEANATGSACGTCTVREWPKRGNPLKKERADRSLPTGIRPLMGTVTWARS